MTSTTVSAAERIRVLNDAFRRTFVGGMVMITAGVGVRSDAAPAREEPGLFVGPATNPELAQIARQMRRGGCFKERLNRTEPHGLEPDPKVLELSTAA